MDLLSPELEERLSALSMGEGASFGMRDTLVLSFGDDGGVAKDVVDWDEPELRRESDGSDGPAPGVGDIAGYAWLCWMVCRWGGDMMDKDDATPVGMRRKGGASGRARLLATSVCWSASWYRGGGCVCDRPMG